MNKTSNNQKGLRIIVLAYLFFGCFFVSKAQDEIRNSPLTSQQLEHCEGDKFYVNFRRFSGIMTYWHHFVFSALQHNCPVKSIKLQRFYETKVYDEPTMVEDKKVSAKIVYKDDHFEFENNGQRVGRIGQTDGFYWSDPPELVGVRNHIVYTRDEHNRVKRADLGEKGNGTRIMDYTYWANTDYIHTIKCYNGMGKLIAEAKYDYLTSSKKTLLKEATCKIYEITPAYTYAKETYVYRLNYNAATDVNQVCLFYECNEGYKRETTEINIDVVIARDLNGNIKSCTCKETKHETKGYDKEGRLTSCENHNKKVVCVSWLFTYDNNNNWITMTKTLNWFGEKSKYLIKRELTYDSPKASSSNQKKAPQQSGNSSTLSISKKDISSSSSTSFRIPDGVKTIEESAFKYCAFTSVTIPNSVTSIGSYAFNGCRKLTFITIPNSVTSIGEGAFWGCDDLTSAVISNSVTSIENNTFFQCWSLSSFKIPNSVTSIGDGAFYQCSSLTSIIIPNSVTSIGIGAFQDCSKLTNITVASGNRKYDSRNNCNAIIETATNTIIAAGNNTTIPNSVTSIGNGAFSHREITSITIPDNIKNIDGAFSDCENLFSVSIPNSITTIGEDTFWGCKSLTSVIIPNSVTYIGKHAFSECGLTSITIPSSVARIEDWAFYGCKDLTSVIIQNPNLQFDFEKAFARCDKLQQSDIVYQETAKTTSTEINKIASNQTTPKTITQTTEQEIYQVVEDLPEFPDGVAKLSEYLSQNIKYPQTALENGIQGRVFVNFVVEPDGSLSNVKVTRSLGSGCDEEAVRVVKTMPKWKPGKQRGKAVRVSYNLPVNFRLQNHLKNK